VLANGGERNTAVGEGAGGCITTHSNIIAIGADVCGVSTAFGEVDNACYIGNIAGASVSAGTFAFVLVDADGKLGTLTMDANGTKVSIPGLKRRESAPSRSATRPAPSHRPRPQASHA
jgi:hypothetical protein